MNYMKLNIHTCMHMFVCIVLMMLCIDLVVTKTQIFLLLITTSLFSMLCIIGCVYDIYQECIHPCMSVLCLVVITQVIQHPIVGHQGLPGVCAKLTNTIWDVYKPSRVCYGPRGDKPKNVKFYACHHGLSCVHIMHHRSNTNVRTHSWN